MFCEAKHFLQDPSDSVSRTAGSMLENFPTQFAVIVLFFLFAVSSLNGLFLCAPMHSQDHVTFFNEGGAKFLILQCSVSVDVLHLTRCHFG